MGLFSRNKDKGGVFKSFERLIKKVWGAKGIARKRDKREAFLTPDLLKRRKEVTKGGRQNLVLQYGFKGREIEYSLQDLNKMASAAEKAAGKFKEETKGVRVDQLVRASRIPVNFVGKRRGMSDFRKAATQIGTAVMYKIQRNMLYFRVTSSGHTPKYGHYQVRIRLEEWDSQIMKTGTYLVAARKAASGRVSFDCTCGRHQYWFRYLATIGGFALDPEEHVFPKIRNPRLSGACCKHVIKALAVLQGGAVHARIAKEMERQAKKKGWLSDKVLKKFGTPKEEWIDEMEAADPDVVKEFRSFTNARKAFTKKAKSSEMVKKVKELKKQNNIKAKAAAYKQIAKHEKSEKEHLQHDLRLSEMENYLLRAKLKGTAKKEAVKQFSKDKGLPIKEAEKIAGNINL